MSLVTNSFVYPYNYWHTEERLNEYIDFRVRLMKQSAESNKELESFYTEKLPRDGDGIYGSYVSIKFNTGSEYQFIINGNPDCLYSHDITIPRCITMISYIQTHYDSLVQQVDFIASEENHFDDTFFITPNSLFYFGRYYTDINRSGGTAPVEERDLIYVTFPSGGGGGFLKCHMHEVYEENNRICLKHVQTGEIVYAAFPSKENYDLSKDNLSLPLVRIQNSEGELIPHRSLNENSGYCSDSTIKLPSELIEIVDNSGHTYTVLFHIEDKYIIVPTMWLWVRVG